MTLMFDLVVNSVRINNMLVNLRGQGDFVNFIWPLFFGLLSSLHYCNTIKETISFSIPLLYLRSRAMIFLRCLFVYDICRQPGDDNRMLVCDLCDTGYHTYCLDPPMSTIPKTGWKCVVSN